jgi:N-acyl-L-homoserine lactone synthetase
MSLMAQCAQRRGVNQLLIAVHPHHAKFYQSCVAFDRIGDERPYEAVQGHPAVALALDLDRAPVDHPAHYKRFFGVSFPEDAMRSAPIPAHMRCELQPVVDASYDAAMAYAGAELAVA